MKRLSLKAARTVRADMHTLRRLPRSLQSRMSTGLTAITVTTTDSEEFEQGDQ